MLRIRSELSYGFKNHDWMPINKFSPAYEKKQKMLFHIARYVMILY